LYLVWVSFFAISVVTAISKKGINKMTISEMIVRLESEGITVQRIPNQPNMLHVDGYHCSSDKGLPPWIWGSPGWGISSCGFGRVFMFRAG
jgi:hypothetical protein